MAPGHMLHKWRRDIERSSNPDEPITARVITRPVLSDKTIFYGKIMPAVEALGGKLTKDERWQTDPQSAKDPGLRRRVEIHADPAQLGAILTLLKKNCNYKDDAITISMNATFCPGGITVEFVDRDEYTLFDFVSDYKAGRLGVKAAAVVSFESAKYDAGANPNCKLPVHHRTVYDPDRDERSFKIRRTCPGCGQPIQSDDHRFCTRTIKEKTVSGEEVERTCGTALFEWSRWRRVGLARLVQKKFRKFFKVYVGDEIHKCQEGRTDIGCADQRILSGTRYSLALTGTLFGGAAGSLFYLLYRRVPEVRRLYAFSDKVRWVDHYGRWEKQWKQKEPTVVGRGASTGIERWGFRQRELPGVGSSVIRFLLPITLFGQIKDLGYELPLLSEVVDELSMTPALAEQYDLVEKQGLQEALQIKIHNNDSGALSAWFNYCRFRPASAFRDEVMEYISKKSRGRMSIPLPSVVTAENPWLPKEKALAGIVRENMEEGRKTLVFVEQTGTRDIRQRLIQALETLVPGGSATLVEVPRVGVLSADDMPPAQREAWITKNAPGFDAMTVNPKIVETGLDLVMFSSLVFYETTTSLYTLWQAMRRVWRLGQTRDVYVTFLAYSDTLEQEILRRMGQKKKAAQLLYGNEAAGVLVEQDSDDIQREIIASALSGKGFRAPSASRIERLFTDGTEKKVTVSRSPLGSMTATSPALVTATEIPSGNQFQMNLFGELIPVQKGRRKR